MTALRVKPRRSRREDVNERIGLGREVYLWGNRPMPLG